MRLAAKSAPRRPAKRKPRHSPMALALAKVFLQVEKRRALFLSTLLAAGFSEERALYLWSRRVARGRA